MYSVGRAAAVPSCCHDSLGGNSLLQALCYGRTAALRIASGLMSICKDLHWQQQYVPMKLLHKETFDPLVQFSHQHHTAASFTETTLHKEKLEGKNSDGGKICRSDECPLMFSDLGCCGDGDGDGAGDDTRHTTCYACSKPQNSLVNRPLSVLHIALPTPYSELRVGPGEGVSIRVRVNCTEVGSGFRVERRDGVAGCMGRVLVFACQ